MKSAGTSLLHMFNIKQTVRPKVVDDVITSLLYTLSCNGLLHTAISDIKELSPVKLAGNNLDYIKSVLSDKAYIKLHDDSKAFRIIVNLLPYIQTHTPGKVTRIELPKTSVTSIVNRKGVYNEKRELRRIIQKINGAQLGYRLFQNYKEDGIAVFYVVTDDDKKSIIRLLLENELSSPNILDMLFKE
jgi:hypothetical protein